MKILAKVILILIVIAMIFAVCSTMTNTYIPYLSGITEALRDFRDLSKELKSIPLSFF